MGDPGVGHGLGFRNLGLGGADTTQGAAGAAPNDGTKAVHVAKEEGVGERQSALAGPAEEASAAVLLRQVRREIDPFRHDR